MNMFNWQFSVNFSITIPILYILDLKYSNHFKYIVYDKKSELFFYVIFKNYSKFKTFRNINSFNKFTRFKRFKKSRKFLEILKIRIAFFI